MTQLEPINWLAARFNVTRQRAYEMVREGLVPAVRLGRQLRVDPIAVEAFIRNGGQPLAGGWRREAQTDDDAA